MSNTTKKAKECEWIDDDGTWESKCGNAFTFNDNGPIYNGFKYCPYCGNKLKEKK